MKLKLILTFAFVSLTIGEKRRQRSTVLTDESKKILEHFDFSNFDKQEALNYLDRQRYDNQIRGKRSKSNLRRHADDVLSDVVDDRPDPEIGDLKDYKSEPMSPNLYDAKRTTEDATQIISSNPQSNHQELSSVKTSPVDPNARKRRGHRSKKKRKYKHMVKSTAKDEDFDNDDDAEELCHRRKKKKKKKKRHYWNTWSQWSPCSVTCGRGRKIRWRKCIARNCTTGELEMGEKTCQLPACNLLTKLLGI